MLSLWVGYLGLGVQGRKLPLTVIDWVWAAHLVRSSNQIFMGCFYICSTELGVEGMRKRLTDVEGVSGHHTGLPVWGQEDTFFLITGPVILNNFHITINILAYCIACLCWGVSCHLLAVTHDCISHILLSYSRTNSFYYSSAPHLNGTQPGCTQPHYVAEDEFDFPFCLSALPIIGLWTPTQHNIQFHVGLDVEARASR